MELVDEVNPKQMEDIFGKMEEIDKSSKPFPTFSTSPNDLSVVESFLAGKTCLTGGSGWWKYEFCYGKYVKQFHVDKLGGTSTIMLGTFDEDIHKEFLISHPEKRPKPKAQRRQLIHFYSKGSMCDKTGRPRQVEVALKCLENAQSPSAVSLYLLEPTTCNYVLGVESPLICNILNKVDEDGLVLKDAFSDTGESIDDEIEKMLLQNN
jgi:endoplasmic reticulum lectin 1